MSHLASRKILLKSLHQGIVGHSPDIFTSSVARKGKLGHSPEGDGGNFERYHEGRTTSVVRKVEITKSGYLIFGSCDMYKINWGELDK